jgi:hypothetical protein
LGVLFQGKQQPLTCPSVLVSFKSYRIFKTSHCYISFYIDEWFTLCATRFNIQQFYVLPTQCINVFCVDLRTNSDYFPIQHLTAWFYNRDLTLQSPVITICTTSLIFNNPTFCPHRVFIYVEWVTERVALGGLCNIN